MKNATLLAPLGHADAITLLTVALDTHVEWVAWLSNLPDRERHRSTSETLAWHSMWVAIYVDIIRMLRSLPAPTRVVDASSEDLPRLAARYLGADRVDDQDSSVDADCSCLHEREQAREFLCRAPVQKTLELVRAQGADRRGYP